MEASDKAQRIDSLWNQVKPARWHELMHSGERKMLYDILDQDEGIESLIGGQFRADTDRLHKHNGVAVATSKRVVFLDKGIFGSTEVQEIPYRNIDGITYSTGMMMGGVQITGRGTASYRIEDITPKDSIPPFVDCVRAKIEKFTAPTPQVPYQNAPVALPMPLVADEIEKLAGLFERGFLTQNEFDAAKQRILNWPPEQASESAAVETPVANQYVKTECDVVLQEIGRHKVAVIKAVREITSLGLKETKELVESAPVVIETGVSISRAQGLKTMLEAVGATIDFTYTRMVKPNNGGQ